MAAGSATAMARNTIRRAAFAKVRRRRIWRCRHTRSFPTPSLKSANGALHVRSLDLRSEIRLRALVRLASAAHALRARHDADVPDAQEPQFLVRVRRHPHRHAGRADRQRHRAGAVSYTHLRAHETG